MSEPSTTHDCDTCLACVHDGQRCCGCYDGACCQVRPPKPEVEVVDLVAELHKSVEAAKRRRQGGAS